MARKLAHLAVSSRQSLREVQWKRVVLAIVAITLISTILLVPDSPRHAVTGLPWTSTHPVLSPTNIQSPQPDIVTGAGIRGRYLPGGFLLDFGSVVGVALIVALMVCFVIFYVARFHPEIYKSTSRMALLAVVAALSVLGLKVGGALVHLSATQYGYIGVLCITSSALLITVLVDGQIAVLVSALMAIVACLVLGCPVRFCVMIMVASLVGILSVSTLTSRADVVRAGFAMVLANLVLTVLIGQVAHDTWPGIGVNSLWAATSGVLSVALFGLGVALFERPFGITTRLGLLELSDPDRPLLRQFCRQAPGSYAHSIMVGNLAAAAAEAIGADSMLARVAAYYHDLGKMMRASFFIENQSGENVHERLKPSLSAIIVNSHVRDGARIADEEKLPPVIRDIIVQHHGTSLMKYFYHRATNGDCRPQDSALEQQFRYPGPKPQTKEAAILMLADVVEAASHMLQKPTPGQIDEFVARMIDEKISDGQLQECPLTLRDLHTIRSVFARQLVGMLHSRVAYPHQENNAGSAFGEIGDLQVDESGVAAEDFGDDRGTGSLFDIDVVDVSSAVEERLKTDRTPL